MAQTDDKDVWHAYRIQMRDFVDKLTSDELRALFWQIYDEDDRTLDNNKLVTAFLASLTPEQAQVYRDLAAAEHESNWEAGRHRYSFLDEETAPQRQARKKQEEIDAQSSPELQEMVHFVGELMDNVDEYEHRQAGGGKRTQESFDKLFRRVTSFLSDVEAAYLTANPVEERDAKIVFTFNHLKQSFKNASLEQSEDEEDDFDFQQSDEEASHLAAEFERMTRLNFPQVVEDIKKCVLNGFTNRLSIRAIMDQAIVLFNAMDPSA